MALAVDPSAAELAEFVLRNDPEHETLSSDWHVFVAEWTLDEIRQIQRAAKQCDSIHRLSIDATSLNERTADVVASVIENLDHITDFEIKGIEGGGREFVAVVDKLLCGLIRSQSTLTEFSTGFCGGPQAIIDFAERFRGLKYFQFGYASNRQCFISEEFALAVATAVQYLTALERVSLRCRASHVNFAPILVALRMAPTLEKVTLGLYEATEMVELLLEDARLLCSASKTIKTFCIAPWFEDYNRKLPVFSFLDARARFSTSLERLIFHNCLFPPSQAWAAMQGVTSLSLYGCTFANPGFPGGNPVCTLLEAMPQLKDFRLHGPTEPYGDDDMPMITGSPSWAQTNDHLTQLVSAVSIHKSLQYFGLDMWNQGRQSFPSAQNLLSKCKGTLELAGISLPRASSEYIYRGIESLGIHLKHLKLDLIDCDFADHEYALFFQALKQNTTLQVFEMEFDFSAALGSMQECSASMHDLLAKTGLNQLLLAGIENGALSDVLEQLIAGLKYNQTLMSLDIQPKSEANLPTAILRSLIQMLHHNTVLHTFTGVKPSQPDVELDFLLKLNRYGRRFRAPSDPPPSSDPPVPLGFWPVILENVAANDSAYDVMFHFLKTKPGLVRESSSGLKRPQLHTDGDLD